jgi:hypothetical protein
MLIFDKSINKQSTQLETAVINVKLKHDEHLSGQVLQTSRYGSCIASNKILDMYGLIYHVLLGSVERGNIKDLAHSALILLSFLLLSFN